jgi:hypothetical protein
MNKQELADTIVAIVKDLNVFVRAANLNNLLVDSNLGQLTGMMQVAILEYQPAIATSASEQIDLDEIDQRAKQIISSFNPVDAESLEKLEDGTRMTIKDAILHGDESDATLPEEVKDNIIQMPGGNA